MASPAEDSRQSDSNKITDISDNPSNSTSTTFIVNNEDHTLGGVLQWALVKNPEVEFAGYSIPHPAEPEMIIRVQTYMGSTVDALHKSLQTLIDVCDTISEKYTVATEAFIGGS